MDEFDKLSLSIERFNCIDLNISRAISDIQSIDMVKGICSRSNASSSHALMHATISSIENRYNLKTSISKGFESYADGKDHANGISVLNRIRDGLNNSIQKERLAQEGIMSSIWEGIKNMLKKIIEFIKGLFGRNGSASKEKKEEKVKAIENKNEEIKDKAEKVEVAAKKIVERIEQATTQDKIDRSKPWYSLVEMAESTDGAHAHLTEFLSATDKMIKDLGIPNDSKLTKLISRIDSEYNALYTLAAELGVKNLNSAHGDNELTRSMHEFTNYMKDSSSNAVTIYSRIASELDPLMEKIKSSPDKGIPHNIASDLRAATKSINADIDKIEEVEKSFNVNKNHVAFKYGYSHESMYFIRNEDTGKYSEKQLEKVTIDRTGLFGRFDAFKTIIDHVLKDQYNDPSNNLSNMIKESENALKIIENIESNPDIKGDPGANAVKAVFTTLIRASKPYITLNTIKDKMDHGLLAYMHKFQTMLAKMVECAALTNEFFEEFLLIISIPSEI